MCGVKILMNMVREIVAPTFLYQSTVKSENRPAKIGKNAGSLTAEILALTSNMINPYKCQRLNTYRINELDQEHFHNARCLLLCLVQESLEG